jgi:hypothetical protein
MMAESSGLTADEIERGPEVENTMIVKVVAAALAAVVLAIIVMRRRSKKA